MKSMIKRIIIGVAIGIILFFLKSCTVHAYVRMNTTAGTINPTESSVITNPLNTWGQSNTWMSGANEWLVSIGQYFYLPNMNGNQLIIVADYYLGIETRPGVTLPISYLNSSRNNLKASKLRCGIGDWGKGYDSTYQPSITDFSVTEQHDLSANNYPHTVVRVRFKYKQKLSQNYTGGSNVNCFFLRETSDDLFMQVFGNTVDNLYFSYTSNLSATVSGDPNTEVLQNLTQQNQTMINNQNTMINQNNQMIQNQQQTNTNIQNNTNAINNQTQVITDTTTPSGNDTQGKLDNMSSNLSSNGTISSLVNMPIQFLQKIVNGLSGSCSPITIGELYEHNMVMPCINPQQYIGIIWNIIDVICAGFLSFQLGKRLVNIFHKITSMKDGGLEEAYD